MGRLALPCFFGYRQSLRPFVDFLVFTVALLFTWLIPYRILMVWLYEHTQSLLLCIIMHVPIVVEKFVLYPPDLSSTFTATSNLIEAGALVDYGGRGTSRAGGGLKYEWSTAVARLDRSDACQGRVSLLLRVLLERQKGSATELG